MKLIKLKKKGIFSLIAILLCLTMLYSANNFFNITGYINTQIHTIKEKEMKYVYEEQGGQGDRYAESSSNYTMGNMNFRHVNNGMTGLSSDTNYQQAYILQDRYESQNPLQDNFLPVTEKYHNINNISEELKKQVDKDSYRNKKFGIYYIFNYDYTMDALKDLDSVIRSVSEAQKVPKPLLTSVLFREMMFLGQEDLLDGLPFIGGKSMGICQIGIENVRSNEQVVHGKDSLIADDSDEEIKEMLQNPIQAVYFCAVQLRARAITLTGDSNVDLNGLDEKQLHKVLEEYNQSKIKISIGPVKTKSKYADETYTYYKFFTELYQLEALD